MFMGLRVGLPSAITAAASFIPSNEITQRDGTVITERDGTIITTRA